VAKALSQDGFAKHQAKFRPLDYSESKMFSSTARRGLIPCVVARLKSSPIYYPTRHSVRETLIVISISETENSIS
jgi:hypothetical protein